MAKFKFDFEKAKQKIESTKTFREADTRFWAPSRNEAGEGFAIVRFLPDTNSGEVYATQYSHSFQYFKNGVQKWYIKPCATSVGGECPICEKNREYWNSNFESDKEIARLRKRKQSFIANVYVVKDALKPENEGKVFLYKYGKKIHEKLMRHWMPSETDMADPDFKQFVPFDIYEGANFKIKVTTKDKMPNYDASSFQEPAELCDGNDSKIEEVMSQVHNLAEFFEESNYPTAETVKKELGDLLISVNDVEEEDITSVIKSSPKVSNNIAAAALSNKAEESLETPDSDEEDEDEAFFKKLTEK